MAHSILIWPLLMSCLCLQLVCNLAEFPKIEHFSKRNSDSLTFLVVGDWGRGGNFNQSRVATQVNYQISSSNFLFRSFCFTLILCFMFATIFTNDVFCQFIGLLWKLDNNDMLQHGKK